MLLASTLVRLALISGLVRTRSQGAVVAQLAQDLSLRSR